MSIWKQVSTTVLGTVLTVVGTGGAAKAIVTTGDPNDYIVPLEDYSGVTLLNFSNSRGEPEGRCTGSLLTGGEYILTAAHCITDEYGNLKRINTQAIFGFPSEPQISLIDPNGYFIAPGWFGELNSGFSIGNDLAVLKLTEPAPTGLEQYDIYRGSEEIGQTFSVVGYGQTGTGDTGATTFDGQKRQGENLFDTGGEIFTPLWNQLIPDFAGVAPGSQLVFDFDNGKPENDAMGVHFSRFDTGLGLSEVSIAPGDSGGPSFIGNSIAGVTSYLFTDAAVFPDGTVVPVFPDGQITDVNRQLEPNASFGEFAVATRVANYAGFVDDVVAGQVAPAKSVPEPSSIVGIIAFSLGWGFWKSRKKPV
ncbi:MAG TPA: trypsin-like serine protease [Coleofasciculaceae cyanobacterium]